MSKGINIWSLTPDLIISLLSDWQMTAVAAWDSEVICLHSKDCNPEDWGLYWWEKLECKNSFLYSNVNEGFTLSCRFMFHVLDFRCWILLSQPCELLSSLSLSPLHLIIDQWAWPSDLVSGIIVTSDLLSLSLSATPKWVSCPAQTSSPSSITLNALRVTSNLHGGWRGSTQKKGHKYSIHDGSIWWRNERGRDLISGEMFRSVAQSSKFPSSPTPELMRIILLQESPAGI